MRHDHGESTSPVEIDPFAPVDDRAMGNLLSAVGNHEGKALLLAAMQPGMTYGTTELHKLFLEIQGNPVVFKGSVNNQIDYCHYSFSQIGAVAKVRWSDSIKYELTESGEATGKAVAGHFLRLSLDHPEISLRDVWSMAKSNSDTGERPAQRRLEIMRSLMQGPNHTTIRKVSRVVEHISHKIVSHHLSGMHESRLIDMETTTLDDLKIGYFVPRTIVEFVPHFEQPGLTNAVVKALNDTSDNDTGVSTLDDVEAHVRAQDERYPDQSSLRNNISGVLSTLAKQGLIQSGKFTGRKLSVIEMSDEQRALMQEALTIVNGIQAQNSDVIAEGQKHAAEIVQNPEKVRALISKAFKKSPEANKVDAEVRYAKITRTLAALGVASTGEIITILESEGITRSSTLSTLKDMRDKGKIESVKIAKENAWAIVQ